MTHCVKLKSRALPYAYWTDVIHPQTGMKMPGLGSNCFFRFYRPVRLNALEIDASGILEAEERIRADIVTVEVFTGQEPKGRIIFEGSLQWNGDTARIEFSDLPAIATSIRCQWKHPVKGIHFGIYEPAQWTIPYRIFDAARWYGTYADTIPAIEPPALPVLTVGELHPLASNNVKAWQDGLFVYYESRYFKASFSLIRPRISHLSWDALGIRSLNDNFLMHFLPYYATGPWTLDLGYATPPFLWGGSVSVIANRVCYHGLTCRPGISMDVEFEIYDKGMVMRIAQRCSHEQHLLEAAVWRFIWNGRQVCSLGTLANPLRGSWRNGRTEARGGWHVSNWGTLGFEPSTNTDSVALQTESGGFHLDAYGNRALFSQIQVGVRAEPFGPVVLLPGTHETEIRFNVTNVEPRVQKRSSIHNGLRRAWGSSFGFRPEYGGLSGNSFSMTSINCLWYPADIAAYTANSPPLPDAMQLVRYTLELGLKGGPHYGAQWEQAHDTAPSLLISAGRIHQTRPDSKWITEIWPHLQRAIQHILDNLDDSGMYTCRLRSGNSGLYERSCNIWDPFCFGHHDGYSGALAYRALCNAAVLAREAGYKDMSWRCMESAKRLKDAYVKSLYNPVTGWLAGWRSRDGKLHDSAYVFINAMAVCFGIVEDTLARNILERLENKRKEVRLDDFRYGIAPQLTPVPREDFTLHPTRNDSQPRYDGKYDWEWFKPLRADGQDTFGVFTNGGLTPVFAYFYLRALSNYGFKETADKMCDQMLESFDQGIFEGCKNGTECFTWDGTPSGYEGTLADACYHVLLAIAQHRGWIKTLEPEWWPA